jgi:hypothetical protein
MTNGVHDRKTGKRIRGAAGISKASCIRANQALEEKGIIRRVRRFRDNGGCDATEYEIQWPELAKFFVRVVPDRNDPPCLTETQAPDSHRDRPPEPQGPSPCLTQRQEQRRSYRGNHHQRKLKQTSGSAKSSDVVGKPEAAVSAEETTKPVPTNGDDEKTKPPARDRLTDPRAEFVARITERHGATIDAEKTADLVDSASAAVCWRRSRRPSHRPKSLLQRVRRPQAGGHKSTM